MAKQSAIPLYQDRALDAYGDTAMGETWLAALDAIIPATPLDYADLFRIIGPDGDESAQNKRVAAILGVNVRTVQRYRRGALGLGGQVRGASDRKRRALLAILGPIARDLILRRFMQLAEISGLAGIFDGAFHISQSKVRTYHHDGGVVAENMSGVVDLTDARDWEGAAQEYWREWLEDWGMPDPDAVEINEVDGWELSLGYPSPLDTETGGEGDPREWMFRDDLAEYHANAGSAESGE